MTGEAATPASAPLLWIANGQPTEQASQVLDAMHTADARGLDPTDYKLTLPTLEADAQRRFDAQLTATATRFVKDLHEGRIDPRKAGFHLPRTAAADFDAASAVRELATTGNVAATLDALEPRPVPYRSLKAALARYRNLSRELAAVHLPPLPARSIGPGGEYSGAPQLRRLLHALGDLAVPGDDTQTLDPALVEAVQHFQRRHGLDVDGVIGPRTFAALSTPLARRVQQIELSMERWRWLSATQRPHIVVNIPQFVLVALPRDPASAEEPLEMRAIVGRTAAHSRTPVFTTEITQVVFQPFWDVPAGILRRELLPRIRADAAVLERYQMEIVRGAGDDAQVVPPTPEAIERLATGELRLRQRPGPANALGPVKFVMPNPFSVYLHATPERQLFEHSQRTFSHGCIRVSDPAALAEYVLRDASDKWTAEAIDAALCGTQTLRIRLTKPVRVIVFYSTAVATRSEGVLFFDDVYGHDRKLQQLLDARRKPPR